MDGFIGEIRAFAMDYVPTGWLPCNGATYTIISQQALYAVIGLYYGGTAGQNFKVPDLRGITLLGKNPAVSGYNVVGATGGADTVALTGSTMAAHNHQLKGVTRTGAGQTTAAQSQPGPTVYLTNAYALGTSKGVIAYSSTVDTNVQLAPQAISYNRLTPNVTPHSNVSPYLALNYCICVEGYFPVNGN
ncbi:phage tail protein [Chitinophaga sancti]|uniref:Microcystin-dependent protein n=1 Tax=Chitinophaga sancti TaxID=1004 RepID=A0A1K1SMU2_9BACT|nr:tail fiber protein [Chitinophaga sancti]WQD63916.1 tail fiber protein [Chitinophaga sancti]WQG90459.1 tail fiber protein [Chitinophaga sancti]SFW85399.1 Microcystin-dependent protein [Chitinophaga sancti]